ncbi:hypothetical protein AAY473_023664 [Plecturocebus cupreus]
MPDLGKSLNLTEPQFLQLQKEISTYLTRPLWELNKILKVSLRAKTYIPQRQGFSMLVSLVSNSRPQPLSRPKYSALILLTAQHSWDIDVPCILLVTTDNIPLTPYSTRGWFLTYIIGQRNNCERTQGTAHSLLDSDAVNTG